MIGFGEPFAMHTTPRSQVSNSSLLFGDKADLTAFENLMGETT
jgi:hypothetical protein